MWGINGATGVLASVSAVGLSMWLAISWSLLFAVLIYAAVAIPARRLAALHQGEAELAAMAWPVPLCPKSNTPGCRISARISSDSTSRGPGRLK